MATVTVRGSGKFFGGRQAVAVYLQGWGVHYDRWGVERLSGHLKESYTLSPDEQQAIIDLYSQEIADLKSLRGYLTQDIVVLSETTQNLDAILEKFRQEHHHIGDEVRFVVDGNGIFTIRKGNLIFDVTVVAGDLLVVPAYTRHWFDLTPERRIKPETCMI